jgi:uncharacterized membrane protein HdeD (DUF308 family)
MTKGSRTTAIRIAGLLIMLLGVAAAFLPAVENIHGRTIVGLLLVAAGAIELAAVVAMRGRHFAAGVAAAATLLAGLRLLLDPGVNFLTVLNLVILWLVVRSAALTISARSAAQPLRFWIYVAAAVDFGLAVLLLAGLPVAVLIYGLFGTTNEIVATFAWVFAASFVAAGLLLLLGAPFDRRDAR